MLEQPIWLIFLMALAAGTAALFGWRAGRSRSDSATTDALRESEVRNEMFFRSAPVMMHSIDSEGRLLAVSDRWLDKLGYQRAEVLGQPATRFLTEESRHRAETGCLPRFAETGAIENERLSFERRDGGEVEVLLSAVAGPGGDSSVSVSIDVTALRRRELELNELEGRHRLILESAGEGIYGLDGEGRTTFLNRAAIEMLGFEESELLGRKMHEILHHTRRSGEAYPESECPIYAAFMDGRVHHVDDDIFWRKDGSSFDVDYTSTPIRSGGSPAGAVVVFRDITESRAILSAVRDSEEQYRGVFEATVDGLTIHRLEDATLVKVNSAMAAMHGYEREEFEQLLPRDYVPEEHLHLFAEMLEAVRAGERFDFAAQAKHRDGHLIDVAGHAVPLLYKGKLHALGVARDVSQAREAERRNARSMQQIADLKDELVRERDYLREELTAERNFGEIVGESRALKRVLAQIEAVAATEANVLVLGETGVGKELIARAIRDLSPRASAPLVKVNCAAVPRDLFESEFFGHVKGAFTGAESDRVGRFQLAHRGTLFLDEVGETPLELQGKLLRVLESGELERVGEAVTKTVDVRVIAATNRDLKQLVEEGSFREDLYFRLNVFPVEVPPLRERPADVLPLFHHFLGLACRDLNCSELKLSRSQADALQAYDWPGNIRELRNVVERVAILSKGERLRIDLALPELGRRAGAAGRSGEERRDGAPFLTAQEFRSRERDNLIAALEHARWRVSGAGGAAELLGLKVSTLRYQMKSMGIERPQ